MNVSLPEVLAAEAAEGGVALELLLPAELDCFRGHFPGVPILPGVVQIDWAIRFAGRYLGLSERVAADFKVKFRRVVAPNRPLRLTVRLDRPGGRLAFAYSCGGEVLSSGHVVVEPQ